MSKSDNRLHDRKPGPPDDPRLPTPTVSALITLMLLLIAAAIFLLRLLGAPK